MEVVPFYRQCMFGQIALHVQAVLCLCFRTESSHAPQPPMQPNTQWAPEQRA